MEKGVLSREESPMGVLNGISGLSVHDSCCE
jgi:hypothetical protein